MVIEERADGMEAQLSHELDEARQLLDASFARAEQLQSEVREGAWVAWRLRQVRWC